MVPFLALLTRLPKGRARLPPLGVMSPGAVLRSPCRWGHGTDNGEGCDTSGNPVRSGRNQLEIIGNQLEITEIWLEIRNQGLENPVEIRKSARNHEKSGKKSRNPREITRNTPFLSAHAHLRNPREIRVTKAGNQLEISWKSQRRREISWKSQKSGNLVRREGPCRTPRTMAPWPSSTSPSWVPALSAERHSVRCQLSTP